MQNLCYNISREVWRDSLFKKFAMFLGAMIITGAANAATDFQVASQLLSAAKAGDVQYVQILVNAGADVNYVDNTGLSIVCTAIMNNDMRAAQILQIYGADSSRCDQQIKNYKNKLPKEESGGLFSGLSNAQSIALAAGGAAIVAGGIFGLTKLLDSDSGGGGGGTEGNCRPGTSCKCSNGYTGVCLSNGTCGNCSDTSTGTAKEWSVGALPVGPAADYNPDFYSPSDTTDIRHKDFAFMSADGKQNYLLMMRGYSPMARGYHGMRTLRYADKTPFPLTAEQHSFHGMQANGGKPIATALITTNGVNATGSGEDGWLVWAECNGAIGASSGCTSAAVNSGTVSRKYYNYTINKHGSSDIADWTIEEDTSFDLSGNGTVFGDATDEESMLAKIVAGWKADGRADGDYLGFMQNGQLVVYRTGGGAGNTDFNNFKAMFLAADLKYGGSSVSDIVANASLIKSMRSSDTTTISDMLALTNGLTGTNKNAKFLQMLNHYYDNESDTTDTLTPGAYAGKLFGGMGTLFTPMIIMSTGEYEIGTGPGKSSKVQEATLENAAPIYYEDLNHHFMSIVAVQLDGNGTSGITNITDYGTSNGTSNKIHLAAWIDDNGTPDDASDDRGYGARACGATAGRNGAGNVDPWCFAAAGANGEQAVAAAAGAVGAVMGAFSYMSTDQVFTLLALTADGPWLGTIDGTATTAEILQSYLDGSGDKNGMYVLPGEYQTRVDNGEDYLSVFAEVFGYGLINLERAVTPGKKIYYYDGTKINSDKPAYWRSASARAMSNTNFMASSVFGSRNASISVPFFDELSSVDGSLSIPRVFENNYSFDNGRRGLYMGDLIGDFQTEQNAPTIKDGMTMNMSFSNSMRADDKMGGLDELSFGFREKNYRFGARYQRHFADGKNVIVRGDTSNPVLALASNALTSDASISYGKWSFGASAFSGSITDETLLQNDPVVSNNYEPLRLGWVGGGQSSVGYTGEKFSVNTSFGFMHESDTTLGTYSDGLLNMGGGDTLYVDNVVSYSPTDYLRFSARGTIARTSANPSMGVITDMSAIDSNAFSFGVDLGNFSFVASRPLAVSNGYMKYATADYEIVDSENGYDLVANPYVANFNLRPDVRETRLSAAYRHRFGDFTTGALGLIYRINPNHTDRYGNEGVVMFKLNHKLGI